jgi:murein DD-endopeptidase MepM/ murein hydrolase activator NlpD
MDEDRGATMETNAHVDRAGRRVVYEHLPRRPELPADYDRYVYPVAPYGGHTVTSGYDLDRRDEMQRRGETLRAVGHGGVDLPQERGSPVKVVSLRGEVGEPEVVFVGDSGALGVVHLHYEVRLVRQGLDPMRVEPPQRLVDQEVSVPCDPRNVLPYR